MKIRRLFIVLFASILLVCILGCGGSGGSSDDSSSGSSSGGSDTDTPGGTTSSSVDPSSYAVSVGGSEWTYDAADVAGNTAFAYIVDIDFSANTAKLSTDTTGLDITTGGAVPVTGVTVSKTTYGITINSTLTSAVEYRLTGTLAGTLTVKSSGIYELYLNGLTVSATAGPAFDLESTQKVFIVTADDTTNTLTDSSTRSMTMKASLYGKGIMVLDGGGTLNVTGSYKHGIFGNDYIRVRGGTINVSVSVKDALRSVNGLIFDDGNLTINATGTTTDDESKGIKIEGSETTGTGKGYIVINGGYITVTSVGKAITAGWDIDEDATTTATTDDPDPYVEINNGVLTLTTTGTPYEYVSGGTTVSCSPEGIEGKTDVTINSGYMIINTTDDAINAGDSIVINGGYIYCRSSDNDAIDSNGTLAFTGGVTVAIGAGSPEGAFDCDTNTFSVTGGTVIGIGGTVSRPTEASCSQNIVILGSLTSGSTMALKTNDGTVAFAYTIPQSYATMFISSSGIKSSTKYYIYTGGTASSDYLFNGLFLDNLSYSNGSSSSSFTTSSIITKLGGEYF